MSVTTCNAFPPARTTWAPRMTKTTRVDARQIQRVGFGGKHRNFRVLFPTPKARVVELVEPTRFTAKLQEPALAIDPTSSQQAEQLPTYNAYSADGDVTAPLVYVNYGVPEDYEAGADGRVGQRERS